VKKSPILFAATLWKFPKTAADRLHLALALGALAEEMSSQAQEPQRKVAEFRLAGGEGV